MNFKIKSSSCLFVFIILGFTSAFNVSTLKPMEGKWKLKKLVLIYGREGYSDLLPNEKILKAYYDSLLIRRSINLNSDTISSFISETYIKSRLMDYTTKGGRRKTGNLIVHGNELTLKSNLSFKEHPKDLEFSISELWIVDLTNKTLIITKKATELYGIANTYEVRGIYEKEYN